MLRLKMIIIAIITLVSISITLGANYWVKDPNNCPSEDQTNFPGQNCAPEDICGDSSGTAQCYDTSTITAPGTMVQSSTDHDSGSCEDGTCNGGYIVDCYATADAVAPFCDNSAAFWCDRNSTCQSTQLRYTNCTASVFGQSVCGNCLSDYLNCDTDNVDCEVNPNAVCDNSARFNSSCQCVGSGCDGWCVCDSNDYDCDDSDGDGKNWTADPDGVGNGCEVTVGSTACATGDNNNQDSCQKCVCDSGYYDCDGGWNQDCDTQHNSACTQGILSGTYTCSVGAGGCYAEDGGTEYDCVCNVDPVELAWTAIQYNWSGSLPMLWLTKLSNNTIINFTVGNRSLIQNHTGVYWNGIDLSAGGTDTSAATECTADEVLLGNGTCINSSSITGDSVDMTNVVRYNQTGSFTANQTFGDDVNLTFGDDIDAMFRSKDGILELLPNPLDMNMVLRFTNKSFFQGAVKVPVMQITGLQGTGMISQQLYIQDIDGSSDGTIFLPHKQWGYGTTDQEDSYAQISFSSNDYLLKIETSRQFDNNASIPDSNISINPYGGEIRIVTNDHLAFRDSQVYINSPGDGNMSIQADTSINQSVGSSYIYTNSTAVVICGGC